MTSVDKDRLSVLQVVSTRHAASEKSLAGMTSEIDRLASHCHKDWRALLRTRANVLVTGPHDVIDEFVETCAAELRRPLIIVSAAEPLALRWSSTLVITNLHLLAPSSQRMLDAWIRDPENSDTQIISLTPEAL